MYDMAKAITSEASKRHVRRAVEAAGGYVNLINKGTRRNGVVYVDAITDLNHSKTVRTAVKVRKPSK